MRTKKKNSQLSEKFKKATGVENLIVKVEKLKNADMPSMITVSEQTRRMSEMMEMYGMSNSSTGLGAEGETLVLNMNNDLVQYVLNNDERKILLRSASSSMTLHVWQTIR